MTTNGVVGRNALGEALRHWRGVRSIEAMAQDVGVNKNTQGAYERGERKPDVEYLVAFAQQTGAPIADLVRLRIEGASSVAPQICHDFAARLAGLPAGGGEVDMGVLTACIAAVDELLERRALVLPAGKRARLVALLYRTTVAKKAAAPPARDVEELVDLAS